VKIKMTIEYSPSTHKITFYTESKEIEIINTNEEGNFETCKMYFKDVSQLVELLKSSPELAKQLKELL
jgi:GTP:adenosylcobinamide-phosphate guanylyltransferase